MSKQPQALTQADMNELENYSQVGDREGYYSFLSEKGYAYGDLALGVVNDDTISGRTANNYAFNQAESQGTNLTNETWTDISVDLMNEDFAARNIIFEEGNNVVKLSGKIQLENHTEAFKNNGLGIEAWTAHAPLVKADGSIDEGMWDLMLDSAESPVSSTSLIMGRMATRAAEGDVDASEWLDSAMLNGANAVGEEVIDNVVDGIKEVGGAVLDIIIPPAEGSEMVGDVQPEPKSLAQEIDDLVDSGTVERRIEIGLPSAEDVPGMGTDVYFESVKKSIENAVKEAGEKGATVILQSGDEIADVAFEIVDAGGKVIGKIALEGFGVAGDAIQIAIASTSDQPSAAEAAMFGAAVGTAVGLMATGLGAPAGLAILASAGLSYLSAESYESYVSGYLDNIDSGLIPEGSTKEELGEYLLDRVKAEEITDKLENSENLSNRDKRALKNQLKNIEEDISGYETKHPEVTHSPDNVSVQEVQNSVNQESSQNSDDVSLESSSFPQTESVIESENTSNDIVEQERSDLEAAEGDDYGSYGEDLAELERQDLEAAQGDDYGSYGEDLAELERQELEAAEGDDYGSYGEDLAELERQELEAAEGDDYGSYGEDLAELERQDLEAAEGDDYGSSEEDVVDSRFTSEEFFDPVAAYDLNFLGVDNQAGVISDLEYNEALISSGQQIQSSVTSVVSGFETDNDALAFISALDLYADANNYNKAYQAKQGETEIKSWFGDEKTEREFESGVGLAQSAMSLDAALDGGDDFGAVRAGVGIVDNFDRLLDSSKTNEVLSDFELFELGDTGVDVGGALALVGFAMALDGGDPQAIVTSGLQAYSAVTGTAIPGLGYVDAIFKLADGDIEGAAISAATTYLMALGPWGMVAAVVITLLMAPDPPEAHASFLRDADGNIDFGVSGTDDGFKDNVEGAANSIANYLNDFENSLPGGLSIDTSLFPKYSMTLSDGQAMTYINYDHSDQGGGSGGTVITADTDFGQQLHGLAHTNIGTQLLMRKHGYDPSEGAYGFFSNLEPGSQYTTYTYGGPDMSLVYDTQGAGVIVEGESDVEQVLVETSAEDFSTDSDYVERGVDREFENIKKTWRMNSSIFSGEGGGLLAIGLASGQITIAEAVEQGLLADPEEDPLKVQLNEEQEARYFELLSNNEGLIIADGVDDDQLGQGFRPPISFNAELDEAFAAQLDFILNRGEDNVYPEQGFFLNLSASGSSDDNQRFLDEAQLRSEIIRELANNEDSFGPNDLNFSIIGDQVTITSSDPQTGEETVVATFEREKFTFGEGDVFTAIEDRPFYTTVEELLANDQEGVVFTGVGGASNGSVSIDADGNIRFIPNDNFFGLASFTYSIELGGETDNITAYVFVANSPDAPLAVDDELTFNENTQVSLNALLLNDSDPDGDGLQVSAVSSVSRGRVVTDSAGNYTYIPEPGYVGDVEILYSVSDSQGTSRLTSVAKSVLTFTENENDAPFVQSEIFADAVEDVDYVIPVANLLANDSDPEGNSLSVVSAEAVDSSQGNVVFDSIAQTVTFVPAANFNGTADILYEVSDISVDMPDSEKTTIGTASVVFAPVVDAFSTIDHNLAVGDSSTVILTNAAILEGVENDDGFPVEVVAVRMSDGETGGQVRIMPNGDVQFTPLPSNNGSVDFEIRLSRNGPDGQERIISTVSVDVITGNDAPVVNADSFTDAVEETAYTFNQEDLLLNDTDAENNAFTFADIRLLDETQGSLVYDSSTGEIIVTPNENVFGSVALSYRVQETVSGQFSTGTAEVVFANTNDTATVSDKTLSATEDTQTIFPRTVLLDSARGETIDADGETLTVTNAVLEDDSQGVISVNASGDVVFKPAENFVGDVAFTFEVTDGVSPISANANIVVTAENDLPIAKDDERLDGTEDQVYTLSANDLLSNDSDVDNALTVDSIRLVDSNQGSVYYNSSTGNIDFTPALHVNGDILFEYTVIEDVTSSPQLTDTAQFRLVLAPVDDTATISNKTFNIDQDDSIAIFAKSALLDESLGELVDADGEVLSVTDVALNNSTDGTLTLLSNGDVQFIPSPELLGVDSYSGFTFTISDGVSDIVANAAVVRGIPPVEPSPPIDNQGPISSVVDLPNGQEEQEYAFLVSTLESAASDPEGDAFSLTDVSLQDPSQGSIDWNRETGNVIVSPVDNVFGNILVNYTLADDKGAANDFSAAIYFENTDDVPNVEEQNFRNGLFNVNEDVVNHVFTKDVLLDGRLQDIDKEELTILGVRSLTPTGIQMVTLEADESVLLTTVPDYASDIGAALDDDDATPANDVIFQIDVTDGNTVETIDMTVRIFPENDAPIVVDDSETMEEGSIGVFSGADLLSNDQDVEGDAFAILGIWAVSNGKANYDVDADQIIYLPDENTIGAQWVDYLVRDEGGAFSVARLNVDIINEDDPAVAKADELVVAEDSDFIFNASEFTANDVNLDDETLSIVAIDDSSFTHGTLTLLPDGNVSYVAEADYTGRQTFRYTVEDESGNRSEAEVEFLVENINDAPRISVLNQTIDEDVPQTYSFNQLLDQSVDVDGDWVTVAGVRSTYGDVTYSEDLQRIEYIPTKHFNSELTGNNAIVEYLLVDENGGQAWGEINIVVKPVNDEPVAYDDVIAAWSRGPITYSNSFSQVDILSNDREYDGEELRVLSTGQGAQGGTISFNSSSGVLSYISADSFVGTDTFSYIVGDGVAGSESTAQVTMEVFENTAPEANDFFAEATEDTAVTFDYVGDFAPHVSDVDINNLLGLPESHKIVAVGNAKNGKVNLNSDGTVTFTPEAHYNTLQHFSTQGAATFDYTVEDIVGNRSTATAEIRYSPADDAPEAVDDVIGQTIEEDNLIGLKIDPINLLNNDSDVDDPTTPAGQFQISEISADNGRLVSNGDGTFQYIPKRNFYGVDNVRYTITDGTGLSDDGKAKVTVTPTNDPPTVEYDTVGFLGRTHSVKVSSLLNNDSDADGDSLSAYGPGISGGNLTINASQPGSGQVRYSVTDGNGGVTESILYYTAQNTAPVYRGHNKDTWRTGNLFFSDDFTRDVHKSGQLVSSTVGTALRVDQGPNLRYYADPNTPIGLNVIGTFSVTDAHGGVRFATEVLIDWSKMNPVEGDPYYAYYPYFPIVFDLDKDGVDLISIEESNALFDVNADGIKDNVSWISNGDALLAFDANDDGIIDRTGEIVFTHYVQGAKTDLEGLHYFDSNKDGMLTEEDELWSRFGLWSDDGDGLHEDGEFVSLNDSNVQKIGLGSDNVELDLGEEKGVIHGTGQYQNTDGSEGNFADVQFVAQRTDDVTYNSKGEEMYVNGLFTAETESPEYFAGLDNIRQNSAVSLEESGLSESNNPVQGWGEQENVTQGSSNQALSDPSLLTASQNSSIIDFPSDEELDHAVALAIQSEASKPHDEDLGSSVSTSSDAVVSSVQEEQQLIDDIAVISA